MARVFLTELQSLHLNVIDNPLYLHRTVSLPLPSHRPFYSKWIHCWKKNSWRLEHSKLEWFEVQMISWVTVGKVKMLFDWVWNPRINCSSLTQIKLWLEFTFLTLPHRVIIASMSIVTTSHHSRRFIWSCRGFTRSQLSAPTAEQRLPQAVISPIAHIKSRPAIMYVLRVCLSEMIVMFCPLPILRIFYFLCELDNRVYSLQEIMKIPWGQVVVWRAFSAWSVPRLVCVCTMSLGGYNGLRTGHFVFICVFKAM